MPSNEGLSGSWLATRQAYSQAAPALRRSLRAEDHHRDAPLAGPLLVDVVAAVEIDCGGPQPLALLALRLVGDVVARAAAEEQLHVGVGAEVVVPGGVLGRPSGRG